MYVILYKQTSRSGWCAFNQLQKQRLDESELAQLKAVKGVFKVKQVWIEVD